MVKLVFAYFGCIARRPEALLVAAAARFREADAHAAVASKAERPPLAQVVQLRLVNLAKTFSRSLPDRLRTGILAISYSSVVNTEIVGFIAAAVVLLCSFLPKPPSPPPFLFLPHLISGCVGRSRPPVGGGVGFVSYADD